MLLSVIAGWQAKKKLQKQSKNKNKRTRVTASKTNHDDQGSLLRREKARRNKSPKIVAKLTAKKKKLKRKPLARIKRVLSQWISMYIQCKTNV